MKTFSFVFAALLFAGAASAGTIQSTVTTGSETCPTTSGSGAMVTYCVQVADSDISNITTSYRTQPQYDKVQDTDQSGTPLVDNHQQPIMRSATDTEAKRAIMRHYLSEMLSRAIQLKKNAAIATAVSGIPEIAATPQ